MTSGKLDLVGCIVVLTGLKNKPENNGREGRVEGYWDELDKYDVVLPSSSKPVKVKPENLKVVAPAPPALPTAKAEQEVARGDRKRQRSPSRSRSRKKQRVGREDGVATASGTTAVTKENRATEGRAQTAGLLNRQSFVSTSSSTFEVSKALSLILRHKAVEFGLMIRPDGFCVIADVLNLSMMKKLQATQEVLQQITHANEKKRFEISIIDGQQMIRAVQGHSLKAVQDDQLLVPLSLSSQLPAKCVHGTYTKHWNSILSKGLLAGGLGGDKKQRNHIHFAPYDYSDKRVISGMRASCDLAIYLDLRKALTAGIPFFQAKNEVILTHGVDGVLSSKYFLSAKNMNTKEVLFPLAGSSA